MEKKKVIGFYDYTVILTYIGLILAIAGIIKAIHGQFAFSLLCLMGAGICDMFDGAVASTKERNQYEKHFGIQIDSLCDLVSFGVLPSVFVYMISGEKIVIGIIACFYVLCGLIRLAYFNVQEFERQQRTNEKREVYFGVPITTSAIIIPLCYILYVKLNCIGAIIFPCIMFLLGVGFIAGVEIRKPKLVGKLIMILMGIIELLGVFLLTGTDIA